MKNLSAEDDTFLCDEPKLQLFTRRAEMELFYAPRRDGTFLRAEPRSLLFAPTRRYAAYLMLFFHSQYREK